MTICWNQSRLKRRCATSWPVDLVFFSDENLGRGVFPGPLLAAGVPLEIFFDHFPSGGSNRVLDTDWIPEVARRGWVALTTDTRLRYIPEERDTIMLSNAAVISLVSGSSHGEKAAIFLACREIIIDFLRLHEPPFIARLYRDRIEMWLNLENWQP